MQIGRKNEDDKRRKNERENIIKEIKKTKEKERAKGNYQVK